jgi:hypothetical protein
MSLRACKECGRQISSDAKVCPHCGKKQRTNVVAVGYLGAVVGLLCLLLLLGLMTSLFEGKKDNTPQQIVQPKPPPPKGRTAKETLAAARELLSSGQPEKVADLVKPLLADPKHGHEARELLNRSTSQMADELAAGMQKSMFDAGEEVYVKATGPNKETIEFSGPLIGAVWVHQFAGSEVPATLKSAGFKRLRFVNSITGEAWSQKLE